MRSSSSSRSETKDSRSLRSAQDEFDVKKRCALRERERERRLKRRQKSRFGEASIRSKRWKHKEAKSGE